MKKAKKPSPKASPVKSPPKRKRAANATILARIVEGPVPYLEVTVRERVTEASLGGVFERVRGEIFRYQAKRLLVDVRGGSVALTISDMLGLAKMVTATFAGVLERFALLLRPQDVLSERFFEPSVNNRGLPTLVTTDSEEAAYWIATKLRLGR
jgi:hypothetical protein